MYLQDKSFIVIEFLKDKQVNTFVEFFQSLCSFGIPEATSSFYFDSRLLSVSSQSIVSFSFLCLLFIQKSWFKEI